MRFKDTNKVVLLKDCLYTPEIGVNLISLAQLDARNCYARLKNGVIDLYSENNALITRANKEKSLYKLTVFPPNKNEEGTYYTLSNSENNSLIWHKRLGHIHPNALEKLGVKVDKKDPRLVNCETCLKAKFTRKINRNLSTKAKAFLDKVSFDICGPISPKTNRGLRYFISFIDSYSRYIEADIIKSKSEAFRSFCAFKRRAENSSSNSAKRPRLKTVKSDNALEFLTKEFAKLLEESGITRELSAPRCPEQNALIERPNRTIMSKVRAMLYEANLPLYL